MWWQKLHLKKTDRGRPYLHCTHSISAPDVVSLPIFIWPVISPHPTSRMIRYCSFQLWIKTRGWQVKVCHLLLTRAIPVRLRDEWLIITRWTNLRVYLLTFQTLPSPMLRLSWYLWLLGQRTQSQQRMTTAACRPVIHTAASIISHHS